jgi:hypothetical protein
MASLLPKLVKDSISKGQGIHMDSVELLSEDATIALMLRSRTSNIIRELASCKSTSSSQRPVNTLLLKSQQSVKSKERTWCLRISEQLVGSILCKEQAAATVDLVDYTEIDLQTTYTTADWC